MVGNEVENLEDRLNYWKVFDWVKMQWVGLNALMQLVCPWEGQEAGLVLYEMEVVDRME